jgi:ankyrin repeat protein
MKFLFQITLMSALLLSFQGCGKKKSGGGSKKPERPPIVTEDLNKTLKDAIMNDDLETAKRAVAEGADVDFRLNTGDTFLTHLIKNNKPNHEAIINLLLENGANTEKKDSEESTPLIIAAKLSRSNIVALLIAHKAQVDEKDAQGNSALMIAIKEKSEEIARMLIAAKANLYIRNVDGASALDLARGSSLNTLADFIATTIQIDQSVPNHSTLLNAIARGDIDAINKLIAKYPEIVKSEEPINPLIAAMRFVEDIPNIGLQMMDILLAAGAPLNGNATDDRRSPLIEAIATDKTVYASLLIGKDADVNKRDDSGWNSLLHAIDVNNLKLVEDVLGKKPERKYTHKMKNGKKVSFAACGFADRVKKRVKKDPAEKEENKEIRKILKCGFYIFTN